MWLLAVGLVVVVIYLAQASEPKPAETGTPNGKSTADLQTENVQNLGPNRKITWGSANSFLSPNRGPATSTVVRGGLEVRTGFTRDRTLELSTSKPPNGFRSTPNSGVLNPLAGEQARRKDLQTVISPSAVTGGPINAAQQLVVKKY